MRRIHSSAPFAPVRQRATAAHRDGERLISLASVLVGVLLLAADVRGQNVGATLDEVDRSWRDGNYQRATVQLRALEGSVARFAPQQQTVYWDLRTKVELASGSLPQAETAAKRHLALIGQAAAVAAGKHFSGEREALTRLAQINRALSGADNAAGATLSPSTTKTLTKAVELYRQALQIPPGVDRTSPFWEAETRFQLASTLASLGQSRDAKAELEAARRSAETAPSMLEAARDSVDIFVQGADFLRQAYLPGDVNDRKRQADVALDHLNNALKMNGLTPLARGKLLLAAAACYQQWPKAASERQVLERLLREAENDKIIQLEPVAKAEALVRLAELTDKPEAQSAETSREQSTKLYRAASELYETLLADATKSRLQSERGAHSKQDANKQQASAPSLGKEVECLMRLQLIYTCMSDWKNAIRTTDELRKLRASSLIRDDPNYYRTLSALGSLYAKKARATRMPAIDEETSQDIERNDSNNAQQYLSQSLEFWRRYQPRSPADLATTLGYYAEVCRYNGEYEQADRLLNEAAGCYDVLYRGHAAADLRLAEFYFNRGAVQAAIGQFVLALGNYNKATEIINQSKNVNRRQQRELLALINLNMAQLYKSQHRLDMARATCERAIEAAREAGLKEIDLVPFKLAQAALLIAEAEDFHARSNASRLSHDEDSKRAPVDISANLSQSLELTTYIVREHVDLPVLPLATARHLQALARYRMYELCGADERQLRSAETLWKEIARSSDEEAPQLGILRVRALNYLVKIALTDVNAARKQAKQLSENAEPDAGRINELMQRAEDRFSDANKWSRDARDEAAQIAAYPAVCVQALVARACVLRAEAQIHHAKAKSLGSLDQTDAAAHEEQLADAAKSAAIQALRKSIDIVEMPRAMTVGAEEERAGYFAQFAPAFDLLVDMLFESGRYIEALDVAEQRRSRTYQDQLRTSGVDLYKTADKAKVEAAKKASDRYYEALAELKRHWPDKVERSKILSKLSDLRDDYVKQENEAKSTSIAAHQLILEQAESKAALAPDKWVGEQIGDDDVALVYYIGAEKSYLFACGRRLGVIGKPLTVSADQAQQRSLPMPLQKGPRSLRADDVVKLVLDVQYDAKKMNLGRDRRGSNVALRGSEGLRRVSSGKVDSATDFVVTNILLPPDLRQRIVDSGATHLVVVPDGALHQLPLELLPYDVGRNKYLLDTLPPICYAPSLSIYRTIRANTDDGNWQLALLSVADPSYRVVSGDGERNESEGLSASDQEFLRYGSSGLERLACFKLESDAVCAAFRRLQTNRGRVVQLLDTNANEAKLKQEVSHRRVGFLHVAAHGLVSQKYNNLFGALALSPPDLPTAEDDGFLSLQEVFSLRLTGCEMAVLSACETNCGAESPLEAGSTMARAFICAGAKRVVCSHWSVADEPTKDLMADFMLQVTSDLSKNQPVDFAAALRAAKIRLRSNSETASPFFWAPFVLIGPPSSTNARGEQSTVTAQSN